MQQKARTPVKHSPQPNRHAARLRQLGTPVALLLTALLGWLYWTAPVTQLADSRYTLLVSHALLHRGTFLLDAYDLPFTLVPDAAGAPEPRYPYQLDAAHGHVVSHYPPGTPLLSAPLLAWQESRGQTVLSPSHGYAPWHDERLQHELAALLTAATVLLLWLLARAWLPAPWNWMVPVVVGLGSPLLSTASRALWSHTWGVLVLTLLLLQLRRLMAGKSVSPELLGTLAAWLYLLRPSYSLAVAATGLLLLDHAHRAAPGPWQSWPRLFLARLPLRFGLTVLVWLTPFWLWAWTVWGHPLPPYYRHPLGNPEFLQALAGNLVSPQRGTLLYCAWLLPVAWLLIRHRKSISQPRLTVWALAYVAVHWILISLNPMWTGGGSYGPRLMTDVVPVFALLLAQALAAWRADLEARRARRGAGTVAGLVVTSLVAILLHVDGAWNTETWRWHTWPHAESESARMWNWPRAEFLAGLWQPVAPYSPGTRIDCTEKGNALPYLLRGWANPEANGTWTMAPEAALVLALPPVAQERKLEVEMSAFLGASRAPQPVDVRVNGTFIGRWEVAKPGRYVLGVPAELAQQPQWRIDLSIGRPQRPDAIGYGPDSRMLGISVASIVIR